MSPKRKKGITAGTVIMLAMLLAVTGGFVWIYGRLSGGEIDITGMTRAVLSSDSSSGSGADQTEDIIISNDNGNTAQKASAKARQPEKAEDQPSGMLTLTVAGSAAAEENIRKSCYSSDSKKYDFTDVMTLLSPQLDSDVNAVFLHNVLDDSGKVSKTVVPTSAAAMLKSAGFDTVFAGFSGCFDRGADGMISTIGAIRNNGMTPVGLLENAGERSWITRSANGVTIAMAQYTSTISSSARKNMTKKNASELVPAADPERIRSDIQAARSAGAQAFVVFLDWGSDGLKSPDKKQKELAAQIAEAGADLIVGTGSSIAHTAEYIENPDGSRTLCVYSLGSILSDSRKAARLAGYILKVTFSSPEGGVVISEASYVPTYVWRYRQDGKYYYRCVAIGGNAPDGMDSDQRKAMEKAESSIVKLLEGSPLTRGK